MESKKIGLIGFGVIGSGVYHLLNKNSSLIKERTGIDLSIKTICDLRLDELKKNVKDVNITDKWEDIINDEEIDIVIELIGGIEPAKSIVQEALKKNKSVVTANKKLLAEDGDEIFFLSKQAGVSLGFEASVAGGIPCILALKTGLVGNRISSIIGILNGTTNYILTKMSQEDLSFDMVLKDAQEKGFAEADPTFDIEGFDAGHKISLLAMLAFNSKIDYKKIPIEGITKIKMIDIKYAEKMGYVIKLLGIAKNIDNAIDIRVHPAMIPIDHPLAGVRDEYNAVMFDCDMTDPIVLTGKGAGSFPTASAVISDVVQILSSNNSEDLTVLNEKTKYLESKDRRSKYYLRIHTEDTPGILSKITGILGNNNISISSLMQEESDEKIVPLIFMIHDTKEEDLITAVSEIKKFKFIHDEIMLIRVEDNL